MKLMRKLRQSGFTMLDATLGMLILTSGMMTTMSVMSNSTTHSMQSEFRIVAGNLAEQKLENILADKSFQGYDAVTSNSYPTESLNGTYQGYTRQVEISEVSSDDLESAEVGSGLKKVTVVVSWGEEEGQSVSLSMVLGNYSS